VNDPAEAQAHVQVLADMSERLSFDTFRGAVAPGDKIVPDHELLYPIGRGSYGEVWLARSVMDTQRAVKIVFRDQFENEEPYEREFKGIQKFEPLSRLHDGFVDILQIGRNDNLGCFYYVMELADDASESLGDAAGMAGNGTASKLPTQRPTAYAPKTLRSEMRRNGRLPVSDCLAIGVVLTSALEKLHAGGLVHRDVKPSNIIFVKGAAKLADIGLVARIEEAQSFVGTPGYIPPEGPGSVQADLFSLGKVLYESSTGKDRQEFPQLPSDLRGLPDSSALIEFNEILLKACESDPTKRYASAEAMRSDLQLLQRGKSVKRKRVLAQQLTFFKRAAIGLIVVAALCGGTVYLSSRLRPASREVRLSANAEALDLYHLGRHSYKKSTGADLRQAIRYFEQALALDPNFAAAHAALASTYCWVTGDFHTDFVKARFHAEKALALDKTLSEPHKALGFIYFFNDWNWAAGEREFKRAIELAPDDSTVHEWYAVYLRHMGRHREAVRELETAQKLDPDSTTVRGLLGGSYIEAGQSDRGIKVLEKVVALETNASIFAYWNLSEAYEEKGEILKALDMQQRWEMLAHGDKADLRAYDRLRAAWLVGGTDSYLQEQLARALASKNDYWAASAYARLGKNDEAFARLEDALARHEWQIINLKNDPNLERLRSDPRYLDLLRRMKFN
jgi:serine/threonine protein kinase